ncbi:unnamed protein product [Pleuronectes platessa]|uniref:Uncharacterized protein n=1 Tax=Pleuronectes platessa TaxID=8262 RepID=A0A9N7YWF2_PLEPL|nr:unnamed protein product [Pleuronectes platessa]
MATTCDICVWSHLHDLSPQVQSQDVMQLIHVRSKFLVQASENMDVNKQTEEEAASVSLFRLNRCYRKQASSGAESSAGSRASEGEAPAVMLVLGHRLVSL